MDLTLWLWIAFWGLIPPAITSFLVGYILYKWGKRQGERSYQVAKAEIQEYVRTQLVHDLRQGVETEIRNSINGIFGPIAKAGTAEARSVAAEYAKENPGILQLLTGVAAKAGIGWGLKQLGAPKEVRDAFRIGGPAIFQAPPAPGARRDPALQPVIPPGP